MTAPFTPPPAQAPSVRFDGTNVTAVLGPTNTGKTFYAIERMVAHSSGTIGLPLRLLAREVYTRVCERVGASAVSLITGEEKIKPPNARYHVCTVEAMPRDPGTAFVAIDEVQLAGDLERGHVFTDRILHARGWNETLLLGSGTMTGVLARLLKGVHTVTRPRLSNLFYAGSKKITRLPRRTAIVAFSADEVYAIAELIRRQRGGAAVVLGALSPRTRNSQVQLYQNGEVDFLVATDAIGMGLNLDVDHVAFAQDWKYDGFQYRQLTPSEFGQIAGRAGRHVRDGTFGVTGKVDPLPDELVAALEGHEFQPVKMLQWRARDLDFASLTALKRSLDTLPPSAELTRALPAVDQRALEILSRDPDITDIAESSGAKGVETLWEACKLPDYRRIAPAQHAEIIAQVFRDLAARGRVAEDYMAAQVRRADRMEGDIDALSQRIAEIRTWTYISHRPGWLADPTHWQEKTRDIEDRLSDALHERLTKRFVDRRTSVLLKRLRENAVMEAEIGSDGAVTVEGHPVGDLQGFRFTPDTKNDGPDGKAVRAAAGKALAGEFEKRAERFANAPNGDIALGQDGLLRWLGAPVAVLSSSGDALKPRLVLLADEQLTGPARDKVAARAERFVTYQVSTVLKPLADLHAAETLEGAARGIAYRLYENYGLIQRREVAEEVRALDQEARAALRRLGVRFGAYHIFVPALVKPGPANLLTLLWALEKDGRDKPGFGEVTQLLATGRTSAVVNPEFDPAFYALAGYRILGRRAVRVDILERLADLIRPALAWKPGTAAKRPEGGFDSNRFLVTPAMMSILGATADDMDEVLKGLGYRAQGVPVPEVEATLRRLDEESAKAADAAKAAQTPAPGEAPAPAEAADGEGAGAAEVVSAAPAEGLDEAARTAASALGESDAGEATGEPASDAQPADETSTQAEAAVEPPVEEPAVEEAVVGEAPVEAGEPASAAEAAEPALEAAPAETEAPAAAAPAAEDEIKLVQVWRLARFEGRNNRGGERRGGGGRRPQQAGAEGGQNQGQNRRGNNQPGASTENQNQNRGSENRRDNRFGGGGERRGREDGNRQDRDNQGQRFGKGGGRPGGDDRRGSGGKPAFAGDDRRSNKGGNDRDRAPKSFDTSRGSDKNKGGRIDPDSPFAKLAALKDKLGK